MLVVREVRLDNLLVTVQIKKIIGDTCHNGVLKISSKFLGCKGEREVSQFVLLPKGIYSLVILVISVQGGGGTESFL